MPSRLYAPKYPLCLVESGNSPIAAPDLEDGTADRRIPELLCPMKVFSLADVPEFRAVLRVVFVELPLGPKSRPSTGYDKRCCRKGQDQQ